MAKIKIFHLPHCGTCKKILQTLNTDQCDLQDIKEKNISAKELDALVKISGSYETLFSRKAIKYQTMGLKDKKLTELEMRQLILDDYTFLKRPVVVKGKKFFAGHTLDAIQGMQFLVNGK